MRRTGLITLPEIEEARSRLPREVRRTPVVPLARSSGDVGHEALHLKLENLQVTGAYKIRAAFHFLGSLTKGERAKGVVLASSGNFGHGFAYAGRRLGVKVKVVTPDAGGRSLGHAHVRLSPRARAGARGRHWCC